MKKNVAALVVVILGIGAIIAGVSVLNRAGDDTAECKTYAREIVLALHESAEANRRQAEILVGKSKDVSAVLELLDSVQGRLDRVNHLEEKCTS